MSLKKYVWIRHYLSCAFKAKFLKEPKSDDLTFVIVESSRGWILDAICRELAHYYPGKARVHYDDGRSPLPVSASYFFSHYNQLFAALTQHPQVWKGKRYVWYTHNSDDLCGAKPLEIVYALNRMDRVFTTNSKLNEDLALQGVASHRLQTLLGAADPAIFRPSPRRGKTVGLSMAYYERKNPQLIADLVLMLPQIKFVLVGKDWKQWQGFKELAECRNFTYLKASYREYPEIYSQFDVFLSPSRLEGGPIPLVETMMCDVVPVVSDTGFARDVIQHGVNGFIFDIDAQASEVAGLVEKALKVDWEVAPSVKHLSWDAMSKNLYHAISDVA